MIVCTIVGPATDDDSAEKIGEILVDQGMLVARLNLSHTRGWERTTPIRKSSIDSSSNSSSVKVPPNLRAVLVDTKGPEVHSHGRIARRCTRDRNTQWRRAWWNSTLSRQSNVNVDTTGSTTGTTTDSIIKLFVDYYDKLHNKTVVAC